MNIKEKMKKNKFTLRDFDTISNSVKMKFVETATLENEISETVKKNELRIDVKLNTEEIEKLIEEFSKRI